MSSQVVSELGHLDYILNRDGFIIFIAGKKEDGKTDFALLLAEWAYFRRYRRRIATNIQTDSYMVEAQITDYQTLEAWLNTPGRKMYILDEAGKHIKKQRFMSRKNVEILDICQLIRHYDCGLVGIAPSDIFIDSKFLNTDILDARIKKLSKYRAKIYDFLLNEAYYIDEIPRTSIEFNSKDIAEFTLKPKVESKDLPLCCRIAVAYADYGTYKDVRREFPEITHDTAIRRHIQDCIKHHH